MLGIPQRIIFSSLFFTYKITKNVPLTLHADFSHLVHRSHCKINANLTEKYMVYESSRLLPVIGH